MGIGASSKCRNKLDEEDVTYCIICYENDIKSQRLVCGHAFCYDCILSIYDYEESPRCPLCRQYMTEQTSTPLEKDFTWFKISRKTGIFSAFVVSSCLFCYNILPTMEIYIQDWNFTAMHGLINDFRIEYDRVKDTWF